MVGALYKWLIGSYGVSFLWVAPSLRDGRPIEYNWVTRAGSEDFAGLVEYTDRFQPGARRYDSGEVSNHVGVATSVAGLELISRHGPERVARHSAALNSRLVQQAAAIGVRAPGEGTRSPHLVGLRLPPDGPNPQTVGARLAEEHIYVSVRGSAMRVSAHVFNTPADIDRLINVLGDVIRRA